MESLGRIGWGLAATALVICAVVPFVSQSSDMVGYPLWASFNINRLFFTAYAAMLLPPIFFVCFGGRCEGAGRLFQGSGGGRLSLGWIWVGGVITAVVHASLPLDPLSIHRDFHHPGEMLVPALTLWQGGVPWRDVMLHQGLLAGPLRAIVGWFFVEKSYWGAVAGERLFLIPLAMVLAYAWRVRLFRGSPGFVVFATFILPILWPQLFGRRVAYFERMILYPLYLLVVMEAFVKGRWVWMGTAGVLMASMVFLTPEMAILALASLVILSARWFFGKRGEVLPWICGFLLLVMGVMGWLARHGAMAAFGDYWHYFLSGYRFIYGMPLHPKGIPLFWFLVVVPGAIFFLSLVHLIHCWRKRVEPTPVAWGLALVAVFSVLYFQKFLCEADDHIYAVVFVTLPYLEWLIFEVVRRLPVRVSVRSLRLGMVGLAAAFLVWAHPERIDRFGKRFQNHGGRELVASREEQAVIDDFRRLFGRVLAPDEPVLDLTNSSLLFHSILGRPFVGRFFQTITLASPAGQRDLISAVERVKPKIVIFDRAFGFDVSHPVPIPVRFHHVSSWLLRNGYLPWVNLDGYALLRRADWMPRGISTKDFVGLTESAPPRECDWGAVPSAWLGRAAPEGDYLEIDLEGAVSDHWIVRATGEKNPVRGIHFRTLDGPGGVYRVPLSNCLQWALLRGQPVEVKHDRPQNLRSLKFVSQIPRELS
ncbi:MAG: hypothetical protein HYR96_01490 [Deltaproteobacteria bacterium]|nr:hypothetical protein [Deltaproteobacteria bacterium]MBI3293317.1 hypothetical protein [Deltaproteobacteria bacterium]